MMSMRQAPTQEGQVLKQKTGRQNGAAARRWWRRTKAEMKKTDWRRVAHSAKVGLALALVSLSVLLQDVFDKLGQNALWAILTVVVIFEYTVGATLSKGLNRGLGTIMAASLGLFVDYMANFTGPAVEPFVVGFSVFVIGMTATYTRFVPSIKAKYDYGVVIFLLTFCLVVISGYRVSDNIDVVFDRIVTVMVGVIICLLVSIFIFPIWAGDDLHKLVIQNFEGLANSLEECLKEYFQGVQKLSRVSSKICKGQPFNDKIYKGYRGVLISKQTEESLANFASWEPRRGRFGCMYPWKRLVEVGAILRHCAYTVSALHGCVQSEIQAPESLRKVFATSCIRLGGEVSMVLRGVACDLRAKQKTRPKQLLLHKVRLTIEDLNYVVRTYPHFAHASSLPNPSINVAIHSPTPALAPATNTFFSEEAALHRSPPSGHTPCPSSGARHSPSISQVADILNPLSVHLFGPLLGSCRSSLSHDPNRNAAHPLSLSPNLHASNHSNPNPCINIDVLATLNQTTTSKPSSTLNSHPIPTVVGDAESTMAGNGMPATSPPASTNAKTDNKPCCMLHESMEFAESLSLASLITLLIEIVARVEHLLDAVVDFQEQAGFREMQSDEEVPSAECKGKADCIYNQVLHHPLAATNVE